MIRMRSLVAVAAALAGGVAVAAAQQPIPQPTRRPKPPVQQAAPQAERMVVYKSPT
jgi:hypothetical protein